MSETRIRDGFIGEKQINVPAYVLEKYLRNEEFMNPLYITYIGYYPKALFHYRERKKGCKDDILFYCLGGKGYIDTHLGSYELSSNQFVILPAGHFHRYQADINDPWTIYWVHFSGEKLNRLNKYIHIEKFINPTPIKYDERFITAWNEMYSTLKAGYTTSNISFANLCLYRFISLFIYRQAKTNPLHEDNLIEDSINFLKENIDKMLTVEDIATQFCYSTSHFSALFKSKTGSSPLEYFIQMKIHYACQLLDQSTLRINEISTRIGYEDPYYFSRLFSKIMGVSPNKYRLKGIKK